MKRKFAYAIFSVFLALAVLALPACDWLGALMKSVSGVVVNARSEGDATDWYKSDTATLVGATVTLSNIDPEGSDYTGTVGSDGSYTITDVDAGTYDLSGSKAGWVFVPRRVELTGLLTTMPRILAYEAASVGAEDVLVMVEWANLDMDVDSYMVRDTDGGTMDGDIVAGYNTGGGYYTDPSSLVLLERDVQLASAEDIPRVETIRVTGATGDGERLRYYLRLFNQDTSGSLTGDPTASGNDAEAAGCTVFVMYAGEHLGTFPVPIDTAENVLGVVQMEYDAGNSQWVIGSFGNPFFNGGDGSGTGGMGAVVPVRSMQ